MLQNIFSILASENGIRPPKGSVWLFFKLFNSVFSLFNSELPPIEVCQFTFSKGKFTPPFGFLRAFILLITLPI